MSDIMVVSVEDVKAELGIDYADDMVLKNVNRVIKTADAYLKGAIGQDYPVEDPRAKEIALMICTDLYENKGLKDTVSGNTRKLVDDISLQLRLELRRTSENE